MTALPPALAFQAQKLPEAISTNVLRVSSSQGGDRAGGQMIEFALPSNQILYLPSLRLKFQMKATGATATVRVADSLIHRLDVDISGNTWSCNNYGKFASMVRRYTTDSDGVSARKPHFNTAITTTDTPNNMCVVPGLMWGPLSGTNSQYFDTALAPNTKIIVHLPPNLLSVASGSATGLVVTNAFMTVQAVNFAQDILRRSLSEALNSSGIKIAYKSLHVTSGITTGVGENDISFDQVSYVSSRSIDKVYIATAPSDYMTAANKYHLGSVGASSRFNLELSNGRIVSGDMALQELWDHTDYSFGAQSGSATGNIKYDVTYSNEFLACFSTVAPQMGRMMAGVDTYGSSAPITVRGQQALMESSIVLIGVESTGVMEFNSDGTISINK